MVNEQKCCICKHLLLAYIIDEDNVYTCPSCENMSCETIVKKGANCTVKVNGGNNEEYFLNKKLLAAAGDGGSGRGEAKALMKQRQYSTAFKGHMHSVL